MYTSMYTRAIHSIIYYIVHIQKNLNLVVYTKKVQVFFVT